MARNGNIILAKGIGMDKEHKNIVNYSSTQMLTLLRSQAHFVGEKTDYSFIKENGKGGNVIATNFTYQECKNANYIAFQNPTYYNKWVFAFIDEVTYENNGCTKITFTVDNWATWYDNLTFKSCFVIREHVNSDTIGEHTIPEGLETGEMISSGVIRDTELDSFSYIIQVTEFLSDTPGEPTRLATNFGGIAMPGGAYIASDFAIASNIIAGYQTGRQDAVFNVYICPTKIINNTSSDAKYSGQVSPVTYTKTITKPTTIGSYTPVNKKVLTYPYTYLILDNNNGMGNVLQYELFSTTDCVFEVRGVPTVGASIKCVPKDYKGQSLAEQEGIMCGKFPTCGWVNDTYTNWLTQNAVNVGFGVVSSGLSVLGGAVATAVNPIAGIGTMISGGLNIAQSMMQIHQHQILPDTAKGNINGGDINTCSSTNSFYFIKMNIKEEFARSIDAYFTRHGYKVNALKIPNITGRTYWNYVEIGAGEDVAFGNLPVGAMEEINNIFRSGTTIWHNHDNIGNFSLNNTIVTP